MAQHGYLRYYQVKIHDTNVLPVYANDFKRLQVRPAYTKLQLLPADEMSMGYLSLVVALEKAKAGALSYLEQLAKAGKKQEIIAYRIAHYEDLNINLIDRRIRQVEQALAMDQNYEWHPYRINL